MGSGNPISHGEFRSESKPGLGPIFPPSETAATAACLLTPAYLNMMRLGLVGGVDLIEENFDLSSVRFLVGFAVHIQ